MAKTQYLNTKDVAERLNISERTVRARIRDGRLIAHVDGGKYYVYLPDLRKYEKSRIFIAEKAV